MINLTPEQEQALERLYERSADGASTFEEFAERAQPMIGWVDWASPHGNGCIIVGWCGMFVGIETDGYTHT